MLSPALLLFVVRQLPVAADSGAIMAVTLKDSAQNGRFRELLSVMSDLEVPTARPTFVRHDESIGLTLLDLALGLQHVHRVTEALTLIDSGHIRRAVSLDLDLRALTPQQHIALRVRDSDRPQGQAAAPSDEYLWVPVSRHSRTDLSPVVVRDTSGDVVPRLTQNATTEALVAGLTRMFRIQVKGVEPPACLSASRETQQRARWLTEAAIARLLSHGVRLPHASAAPQRHDAEAATGGACAAGEGGSDKASDSDARRLAVDLLAGMDEVQGAAFDALLRAAASDYLLVVMLPKSNPHQHLSYEAPLIGRDKRPRWVSWRAAFPLSTEYTVAYHTQLPRAVSSYHLTVEVPPDMHIRRCLLCTDADEPAVRELIQRVDALAGLVARDVPRSDDSSSAAARKEGSPADGESGPPLRGSRPTPGQASDRAEKDRIAAVRGRGGLGAITRSGQRCMEAIRRACGLAATGASVRERTEGIAGHGSALEIEYAEVLAELGALGQRRDLDVDGYLKYLAVQNLKMPVRRMGDASQAEAVEELQDGKLSIGGSRRLLGLPRKRRDDVLGSVKDPVAVLQSIAEHLRELQLGRDVSADNDPRENGAHAQWRRLPVGFGAPTVEPVKASVYLALADEPPALVGSVARMVLALTAVVLGVEWAATEADSALAAFPLATWSLSNTIDVNDADAIVAVLLIVPGILISRLDIPHTRSVLGTLRRFPSLVAYTSLTLTTLLAIVVAASATEIRSSWFRVCAILLFILYLLCGVETWARWRRRKVLVPGSAVIPAWLDRELCSQDRGPFSRLGARRGARRRRMKPEDAVFHAIRSDRDVGQVNGGVSSGEVDSALDRPAELADVVARAVTEGRTSIEYTITHGRLSQPSDVGSSSPPATTTVHAGDDRGTEEPRSDDTVFLESDIGAVQMSSRAVTRLESQVETELQLDTVDGRFGADVRSWSGTATLAPSPLRTVHQTLEYLITVSEGVERTLEEGRYAINLLTEILQLTVPQAGDQQPRVVPTAVRMPAGPVPAADAGDNPGPGATDLAMRLSFAVPRHGHSVRLDFETALLELCNSKEVHVQRASRRPGAGQGDWEPLPAPCKQRVASAGTAAEPDGVALTIVGPAGVLRYAEVCRALARSGLAASGIFAGLLGQQTVVHVGAMRVKDAVPTDLPPKPLSLPFRLAVKKMEEYGLLKEEDLSTLTSDVSSVYVCFDPALEASNPPDLRPNDRKPLWVAWEVPRLAVAQEIFAKMLITACEGLIGDVRIAYWHEHRTSADTVRGRAQLMVLPRRDVTDENKGVKAKDLQTAVLDAVVRDRETPAHLLSVHASWSEHWLERRS